jgi:23S rRNA pseudouridine1911/1915/1917 synthase
LHKIIYEDESLLIVDKPQGLASATGRNRSLCEDIFRDFPGLGSVNGFRKNEGGLLNRLDNETGGLVFFARSDESFKYYSIQMKNEKIEKYYYAVVEGIPSENNGVIDCPIAHDRKKKKKMVCLSHDRLHRGKEQSARTFWKLINTKDSRSLLDIKITKGVRHQIRVHLSEAGFPIAGDKIYNKKKYPDIDCHLLYCYRTVFINFAGELTDVRTNFPSFII